MGETQKLN